MEGRASMRIWMKRLVRVLMVVFGLALAVAGPVDGEWAITATGVGLIAGATMWWFVDRPSDAPPATTGSVSTALGSIEHGLRYPIPARKRWVLAIGTAVFGTVCLVMTPAMRDDGEGLWWLVGGFGLLMLAATPWLVKLARNPSYLAATRSGITYHGAKRTTTTSWADIAAVELFEMRHPRGGRTRMLGIACDPYRIHGLSGWQRKLGTWGMHSYGYTQSWPTWQFDADPADMVERLNGYLADPDSRGELDSLAAEQPTTGHEVEASG